MQIDLTEPIILTLDEEVRIAAARAETIDNATPAHYWRAERKVVVMVVTHDFEPGWLPPRHRQRPDGAGHTPARYPDPERCRHCSRREGHVSHDTLERYFETMTSVRWR